MIDWFLFGLIGTGLITRFFAHKFHIVGKDLKKQKTLTGFIRRKLKFEFHHIHFGFIILFLTLIYYLAQGEMLLFFLGVSLSLIVDQLIPLFFSKICYFSRLGILISFLGHLFLIFVYLIL